jgi:uncharacterized protein YigE (DUF2233 family)
MWMRLMDFKIWSLVIVLWGLPQISFGEGIVWERLTDGFAVSVWNPGGSCPTVPGMLAIDVDPDVARFSVHYYADEKLPEPITIDQWRKVTGHDVLFNAGLFRENFAYLGLLYKGGRSLGSRRHNIWQGLFVADPIVAGTQKARVLDLSIDNFDEKQPPYREAAQALMLLGRDGKIRVRKTGKQAYQTIVAETENGHILIFKSRNLTALYDIAQCLRDLVPTVRQAMAMDGGSSSDVLVSESLWRDDRKTDDHIAWKALFSGAMTGHIPLPSVIGVSRR